MSFTFQTATRSTVRPLIGLFGKSGGGKTMTALLLARGLVGPQGKIGLIDTESGRGSLFSDQIPGGYKVLDLDPPFSPERYMQALDATEGLDIAVIDSTTHDWNGEGGYLDMKESALERMAGSDWKKREKCAMAAAAQCKPKHNRFVMHMLRMKIPLILCFRGRDKVKMDKAENGSQKITVEDFASPIQDSGLIFEMLIAGEVFAFEDTPDVGGFFRATKVTHPDIRALLPQHGEQMGIKHGEAIARWANNPGSKPSASQNDVLRDFLLLVNDATDGEGLTPLVAQANAMPDEGDTKKAKKAIVTKATKLGLEWWSEANKFVTKE